MTYSDDYFYLLSACGQLFVEETTSFLVNMKSSPPTFQLSKPLFDKLSSKWPSYPHLIDYANTENHFCFTKNTDENTGPNSFILRMIVHTTDVKIGKKLHNLCFYSGFQVNGKAEPVWIEKFALACDIISWSWPEAEPFAHWFFWFNDNLTVYLAQRQSDGQSEEGKAKWRFVEHSNEA